MHKASSESLMRLESLCESQTTDLLRWRSESSASSESFASEAKELDAKLREAMGEEASGTDSERQKAGKKTGERQVWPIFPCMCILLHPLL